MQDLHAARRIGLHVPTFCLASTGTRSANSEATWDGTMQTKLEARVREELDREGRVIETLRRDPARLTPEALMRYSETMASLDAAWDRARDAVEALACATGEEAATYSAEFGDAWRLLKAELFRVQPRGPMTASRRVSEHPHEEPNERLGRLGEHGCVSDRGRRGV